MAIQYAKVRGLRVIAVGASCSPSPLPSHPLSPTNCVSLRTQTPANRNASSASPSAQTSGSTSKRPPTSSARSRSSPAARARIPRSSPPLLCVFHSPLSLPLAADGKQPSGYQQAIEYLRGGGTLMAVGLPGTANLEASIFFTVFKVCFRRSAFPFP